MSTFKSCEEYVLAELEMKDKQLSEMTTEAKRVADEANQKIGEMKNAVEYANRVIGILSQLNELGWKDGKDAEGNDVKVLCIYAKQGPIKLDPEGNKDDKYVYELLAPILGTEEIKAAYKAAREAEDVEEAKATADADDENKNKKKKK